MNLEKINPLVFIRVDEKSWVAPTPIGRYFIDFDNQYEIYSDIEEFGAEDTLEKAIDRANAVHANNIFRCYRIDF